MKQIFLKSDYIAPKCAIFQVHNEGVLCASTDIDGTTEGLGTVYDMEEGAWDSII